MGSLFKKTPPAMDIQKADYRQAVKDRVAASRGASLALLDQLDKQTNGQGPSLANAQMQAATNRNLSDLLKTSAANRRGGALAANQIINAGSANAMSIGNESAQARAQEIEKLQALQGAQGINQQSQDLAQVMEPGRLLANAEMQRYEGDIAHRNAVKNEQNLLLTGGLSSLSKAMGSYASAGGGSTVGNAIGGGGGVANASPNVQQGFVGPGGQQSLTGDLGFAYGGEVPENSDDSSEDTDAEPDSQDSNSAEEDAELKDLYSPGHSWTKPKKVMLAKGYSKGGPVETPQMMEHRKRLAVNFVNAIGAAHHAHDAYANSYADGGAVDGVAPVAGDSPTNDTVPATLSPGEVVLPRSVTQAPDAPDRAHAFMEAILKQKYIMKPSYKHVVNLKHKKGHK